MTAGMTLSDIGSLDEYEAWWQKEARPLYEEWLSLPFFADLKSGKLTEERLKVWLENWYNHVQECDIHRPVLWQRHHYIVGRFPQMEVLIVKLQSSHHLGTEIFDHYVRHFDQTYSKIMAHIILEIDGNRPLAAVAVHISRRAILPCLKTRFPRPCP